MSALIIGGIAFMCGGAIGAAWFVTTMKREKSKRKAKRKEKPKRESVADLMDLMNPGWENDQPHDPDPDALLFETEAAPDAEQPNVMGPYVWNTDEYVNGNNYGPSGNGYLRYTAGIAPHSGISDEAARRIVEVFGHKPLPKERPPGSIRKHPYG